MDVAVTSNDETICEKCGVGIRLGDHPFCPHGHSNTAHFRDEIPGGVVLENYGPEPMRFDSHSERKRWMGTHGLQEREKWAPFPGTDRDPAGIANPKGYMDEQTRENARILLSRNGRATKEPDIPVREFNMTVTGRDAAAVVAGDPRRSARVGRRTHGSR